MHRYVPAQCATNLATYTRVLKEYALTDTIELIFHKDRQKYRRSNPMRLVCDIRPQKTKTFRKRLNAGGNIIDYPGEVNTPTSDLTTMKFHVKITISDITSRYMCMDVKYLYLNNQMDRDE